MSSRGRPNCYVFGIIGKLFKNVREWWVFHVDILRTFQVIQVSILKIYINLFLIPYKTRVSVSFISHFISHVSSCLRLQEEEEPQMAYPMSITWVYHNSQWHGDRIINSTQPVIVFLILINLQNPFSSYCQNYQICSENHLKWVNLQYMMHMISQLLIILKLVGCIIFSVYIKTGFIVM